MEFKLDSDVVAIIEAIDSFVVEKEKRYCVIANLLDGEIKENLFLNIPFNNSFGMTTRITHTDSIQFTDGRKYVLVCTQSDDKETLDMLLSMNVSLEKLKITISGED